MKRLLALVFVSLLAVTALAQEDDKSGSDVQVVQMRVSLFWADGTRFGENSRTEGGSTQPVQSSGKNYEIRVRVMGQAGNTIQEQSPSSEGVVTFNLAGIIIRQSDKVRFFPAYTLRILGDGIEEQTIENVQPGMADRTVTVELHRKGEKRPGGGGLVSASSLKLPRGAEKEFQKGQKELAKNKLPEARTAFERAVKIYPKYDQAYNGLGVVLMKQGDAAAGRKAFEQAVAANDKFAPGYVNLARVQAIDKNYDAAAASLSRSLSLEPLNAEALSLLCQYDVIREKYDEVPALAQKMHSVPHDGEALGHFAAGNALEHLNRPTDAIYEYMLFMQEDPTSKLSPAAKQEVDRLRQTVGQASPPQ